MNVTLISTQEWVIQVRRKTETYSAEIIAEFCIILSNITKLESFPLVFSSHFIKTTKVLNKFAICFKLSLLKLKRKG